MVQTQRVIPLKQIEVIGVGHDGDGEGTLQLLGHAGQRRKRQLTGVLQELYSDVRVCFDLGGRQIILAAQPLVVTENAVVGQRKGGIPGLSGK